MKNIIIGDSYVQGLELEEEIGYDAYKWYEWNKEDIDKVDEYRNSHAFHYHVFKELNVPYKAYHKSGCSNRWIAEKVIEVVENQVHKPDNIIVCWTGDSRLDRMFQGREFIFNPRYLLPRDLPKTNSKLDKYLLQFWLWLEKRFFISEEYYEKTHKVYVDIVTAYLRAKGVNYIYLKSVESNLDLTKYTDQANNIGIHEYNMIRHSWRPKEGYGKGGHFLSPGHKDFADYILPDIKKWIKVKKKVLI